MASAAIMAHNASSRVAGSRWPMIALTLACSNSERAEIAGGEFGEKGSVLRRQGLIQTESAAQFLFVGAAGGFAEHDFDRVAGNQVNQQKHQ